jgi:nitrogen fixation NifU-like protein
MNTELQDLYQEVIIDHNDHPCNFRIIDDATSYAEGYNPMCGDRLMVYLKLKDGIIEDIAFTGAGCAISKASASIMTSELMGMTVVKALELFQAVHNMLTQQSHDVDFETLGKIAVLSGVSKFPMRIKCASLAWHAMRSAIQDKHAYNFRDA